MGRGKRKKCFSTWKRSTNYTKNNPKYVLGTGTYVDPFVAYGKQQTRRSSSHYEDEQATRSIEQHEQGQAAEKQRREDHIKAKQQELRLRRANQAGAKLPNAQRPGKTGA